mgnify:FL=1
MTPRTTTVVDLGRTGAEPLTMLELARIVGTARAFWRRAAPERATMLLPGVPLQLIQELPPRLEGEEKLQDATIRAEIGPRGVAMLIFYPRYGRTAPAKEGME